MNLLISFSLSFLLLLQTLSFGATEILLIGNLIEHAQLHSEKYGDSVQVFLMKHYGSLKKEHLPSHNGHDKLPFNHHSRDKMVLSAFLFSPRQVLELKSPDLIVHSADFFYANTYSSLLNKEFYQPPKSA